MNEQWISGLKRADMRLALIKHQAYREDMRRDYLLALRYFGFIKINESIAPWVFIQNDT